MLFHAFRVVYTGKELDSEKIWTYNSISVPKISLPDSYKFRRVFFDRCSL